jgi:hypothetical protein
MAYHHADAEYLADLKALIGSFGMPFSVTRKFNGMINAVIMQVEDGDANTQVVDTLFVAALQLASSLEEPQASRIAGALNRSREEISKRLRQLG